MVGEECDRALGSEDLHVSLGMMHVREREPHASDSCICFAIGSAELTMCNKAELLGL